MVGGVLRGELVNGVAGDEGEVGDVIAKFG
jgi:hypothetical protein